jgi:predicted CXXCH cytochrome family protein
VTIATFVAASLAIAAISCGTFSGTMLAPPQIPGATFAGSKSCEQCHEEITKKFKTADHARLMAKGDNAQDIGCESCHGPGSIHIQTGGQARTIINPRRDPETCYQCHLEKRASFSTAYHHPLEDGKVSCADCHNPHEGRAIKGGGTSEAAANEVCFKCHTEQRGPFVFPHEAMREGCTTCHNPHGSVNQKMLLSRNTDLCYKCHFQQQLGAAGSIYHADNNHSGDIIQGTCWSGGCHEKIHGSNVQKHLRY